MRILLVAFGILTVFWSTPAIQLGDPDARVEALELFQPYQPRVVELSAKFSGSVGRASLIFATVPRRDSMPVMPDLPQRLDIPLMDTAPDLRAALVLVDPGTVVPTSARRDLRLVTALSLNMRTGPTKKAKILQALQLGDAAFVTGAPKGGWVPVELAEDGRRGWVFGTFLKPKDS